MSQSLESHRKKIDEIDRQLVTLLEERGRVALEIGRLKAQTGRDTRDPAREAEVFRNVLAASTGPFDEAQLRAIFREIIGATAELQRPTRVAYLGPPATFTHEAAMHQFGSTSTFVPARTIREVFSRTEKGEADYGVVPVENSTDGAVTYTLDVLAESDLKIRGEVSLPISHHLLCNGTRDGIKKVCSHPQALAQTRGWLAENLPNVELSETSSTARAAQIAADDPSVAAVANGLAAEVYGVNILERRIEDNPHNYTRFLIVGREMARRTGEDKTALLFSVEHKVGALHDALGVLAGHGVNLTQIESRPLPGKVWEYLFFVDIQGHPDDEAVRSALEGLKGRCAWVRVLGAWPVSGR